jgi:16S rRNA (uracil1498-N3)-methyltransferase
LIRLFVRSPLSAGAVIAATTDHAHYLGSVMRLASGAELRLFNGADGEWSAKFVAVGRRGARFEVICQERAQAPGSDLDLIIALVKRSRLETIIEKAAELGARRVRLAITARTNSDRTNVERLAAIAIEAAEQTGRLDAPELQAPERLATLLAAWPAGRRLMFCDEAGDAASALDALAGAGPWAVLIGPEGGFTPEERAAVRAVPGAVAVSLGPRILRADTAAIAALTLWQAKLGDWRGS